MSKQVVRRVTTVL